MSKAIAFLFPGQGSQSVGMLSNLAAENPIIEQTFELASQAIQSDLWKLAQEGPEEKLNQTQSTQPVLLTASVAIWRLWQEKTNLRPVVMAGHSLGEYSALVCAEVLTLEDAVRLVTERGRLMQEAVPVGEGAMAAIIGLDNKTISDICQKVTGEQVVEPVNFNSPGQVVIAGHTAAVNQAMEQMKEAGAKRCLLLPVSIPSHCRLMKPAADKLASVIDGITFNKPKITVINNVDADQPSDPLAIKDALIRQLYRPVCWVDSIKKMLVYSVLDMVECGPGKVLSGLNKRIDKSLISHVLETQETLTKTLETLEANEQVTT